MLKQCLCILSLVLYLALGARIPAATAFTAEQQLFNEAWRVIQRAYVDPGFNGQDWSAVRQQLLKQPLRDRTATYTAITDMLATLDDPFTRLLPPDQYTSLQTSTAGELTGVGLQIALNDAGQLTVLAPIDGSPAAAANLQTDDIILKIDDRDTDALSLDEAANLMRGRQGTTVTLQVERLTATTDDIFDIALIRNVIEINPVQAELRRATAGPPFGYIRLRQFNANASREMETAVRDLQRQGAKGYILDLRNNPGGLLQAGVEIARLWLNPGPIVYTVDRQGVRGSLDAQGAAYTTAPLVVLVNRGSASASEILAGALQDRGRGQLVGEQTFGKGSIQSLYDLSDGAGLAVTIAKYETPKHRNINKVGIRPDHIIKATPLRSDQVATAADPQYQAAVQQLAQTLVPARAS